jgi:hypothetical protein
MKPNDAIELNPNSDISLKSLLKAHEILGIDYRYFILEVASQNLHWAAQTIAATAYPYELRINFQYEPDEWSLTKVDRDYSIQSKTVWSPGA